MRNADDSENQTEEVLGQRAAYLRVFLLWEHTVMTKRIVPIR